LDETIALIDKIIEEHKTIIQRMKSLEQVANDAEAMAGLDKAKEVFMPGRLEQKEGLKKLQELQKTVEEGIRAHFTREETGLLSAFEKQGDTMLLQALRTLLLEHRDLRQRLTQAKKHVTELTSGKLSRNVWEATAHDMRAHISHTRKLLEAHAQNEQELLHKLRNKLMKSER